MHQVKMMGLGLIIAVFLFLLAGCGVQVKHHWGFMGPDTWEATDGRVSVHAYRGTCWEAERALQYLADRANSGALDWSRMSDPEIKSREFGKACAEVSR